MKKFMKSKKLKNIVVKCSNFWADEIEIDSEIFDDVYLEAATRALEKRKNEPGLKVTVLIECWEKKNEKNPNKHFCYNTYFILINSGMHEKAEILRTNFLKIYGTDLQNESIKGDNGNTTNTTGSN